MNDPYEQDREDNAVGDDRIDLSELELEEQAKQDVKLEDWLNDVYKRLEEKKIVQATKDFGTQDTFLIDALKRNKVVPRA